MQHKCQNKKDKQQSTKHTLKTKDRVTRTPLKTGGELRCYLKASEIFPDKRVVLWLYKS